MESSLGVGLSVCLNVQNSLTKIAAMPIFGKTKSI